MIVKNEIKHIAILPKTYFKKRVRNAKAPCIYVLKNATFASILKLILCMYLREFSGFNFICTVKEFSIEISRSFQNDL